MNKKILVTGSEGFIGQFLVSRLKESGHEVIGLDKKSGDDLCDQKLCNDLPNVDIVYHLAAFNGTKWFYERPFDVVQNNTEPTLNLLKRYARGIELFVFAGTCESYAGSTEADESLIPTDESVPLRINDILNPRWSYGGSKIGNEVSIIAAHKQFNMNFQILRFHNIFGPNQIDHFFSEFIERAKQGDLKLFGHENTRSFLYIDDAIDYVIELMNNTKSYNEILNIGSSHETTIKEVAEIIIRKMDIKGELTLENAPQGSVRRRVPKIDKLLSFCKKDKHLSLEEGIDKILERL